MIEQYDYALVDIVANPPYSHSDMIYMLADGKFIIEGKQSTIQDAYHYADEHAEVKEVWETLRTITQ